MAFTRRETQQSPKINYDLLPVPKIPSSEDEPIQYDLGIMKRTASTILSTSLKMKSGERLFVYYQPQGKMLLDKVTTLAREMDIEVFSFPYSHKEQADLIRSGDQTKIDQYATSQMEILNQANPDAILNIIALENCSGFEGIEKERAAFSIKMSPFYQALMAVGGNRWNMTTLPTPAEAKRSQLSWEEYYQMNMKALDRPWKKIHRSTNILVQDLTGSKMTIFSRPEDPNLRKFTTRLSIDIRGKGYADTGVQYNNPGAEVFTGPRNIRGVISCPYPIFVGNMYLPNLTLYIKDGIVVRHVIYNGPNDQKGNWNDPRVVELLDSLKGGDGKVRVGELGFGLNKALPLCSNSNLMEKRLGFHIGLGWSWEDNIRTKKGKKVRTDNKSRAERHIDFGVSTMDTHSIIIVDRIIVQKDGIFLDPRLRDLNRN